MSQDQASLEAEIAQRSREIKTDGYAMSVGEVLSLYRDGDLDIHPEFQRIYRWNDTQKSRLIESILLGIPIPPIFVSQRDDGVLAALEPAARRSPLVGQAEDMFKQKNPSAGIEHERRHAHAKRGLGESDKNVVQPVGEEAHEPRGQALERGLVQHLSGKTGEAPRRRVRCVPPLVITLH